MIKYYHFHTQASCKIRCLNGSNFTSSIMLKFENKTKQKLKGEQLIENVNVFLLSLNKNLWKKGELKFDMPVFFHAYVKKTNKKIHLLCKVKKSLFSLKHLLKKYSNITKLNSIPVSKTLPSPFRITQLHPRSFLSPFLSGESWTSNLQLGEVTRYRTYVFSCFSPWKLRYRYVL